MINEENKSTENTGSTGDSSSKIDKSIGSKSASTDSSNKDKLTAESIKSTATDILGKAKDSAGQAYGLAAEKATSTIEEQKGNLSSGLSGVADSIRQVGQNLRENKEQNSLTDLTAKYSNTAADQIERISGYIEGKDLQEILHDVKHFAQRQPAIFIGIAFAAGLLTVRFLKSSGSELHHPKAGGGNTQPKPLTHEVNNQNKPAGQAVGGAS